MNIKYYILVHISFIGLLIGVLYLTTSCSPSESGEILSIFFDGVPENVDESEVTDTTLIAENPQEKTNLLKKPKNKINFHPPYQSKDCDDCHESSFGNELIEQPPELCYTCHDDFQTEFAVLHGPVASGYCTQCHNPHFSKNPSLLIKKGQDICLSCHEKKDVLKNDVHLEIEDTNCTDCHNPHGGEDRFLI
jgi:predicted CXXCH cytochrome family protein